MNCLKNLDLNVSKDSTNLQLVVLQKDWHK